MTTNSGLKIPYALETEEAVWALISPSGSKTKDGGNVTTQLVVGIIAHFS
jgi:hypothetical protein